MVDGRDRSLKLLPIAHKHPDFLGLKASGEAIGDPFSDLCDFVFGAVVDFHNRGGAVEDRDSVAAVFLVAVYIGDAAG